MPFTRKSLRKGGNSNLPETVVTDLLSATTPSVTEMEKEGEDFGRDKDIKNLLKTLQPKVFTGEGSNVPKDLEEWIMSMDNYFDLAGYNTLARGIMGRAKLDGSAKLWWKLSCQYRGEGRKCPWMGDP